MNKIEKLNNIIKNSKSIVFFGGAGVSTESGIPDFRGTNGLYTKKYDRNPEYMLSHDCFLNEPDLFYSFFFDNMIFDGAEPNYCHKKLAQLEKSGKLSSIITQNIDGLHQLAGSNNVLELHGNVNKLICSKCGKVYSINEIKRTGVPFCGCDGIIKPNVVLYGEELDEDVINKSLDEIKKCDTLIVGGTSLVVYPAAGFIKYFKGKDLVVINKNTKTYIDDKATLVINDSIGEVFKKINLHK